LFVRSEALGRLEHSATCASFSRFIRIDSCLADPAYVFWHLQYLYSSGRLAKYHTQHTGVARFQYTTFATREQLSLPPPTVQRKIAAILSVYDELIANNNRRIAILEEMARLIYQEWFVHFRFPGREDVPTDQLDSGALPKGWRQAPLSDIAVEVRRPVDPAAVRPNTPYVGLEHLPRRSITLTEWGEAGDVQSTKLQFLPDQILYGKIRPYFHKVAIAPMAGICSSDVTVLSPRRDEYFGILASYVSSDEFVDYASKTSQGTKMPRANWNVLFKYPIVLPSTALLEEFDQMIRDFVRQLQILSRTNQNLRDTRDLLIPKLISGDLDVEHLDIHGAGQAA